MATQGQTVLPEEAESPNKINTLNEDEDFQQKDLKNNDKQNPQDEDLVNENEVTEVNVGDREGTASPNKQVILPVNESLQQSLQSQKPKIRIDRLGNTIIPRRERLKQSIKSTHKVTYIDQIHMQE